MIPIYFRGNNTEFNVLYFSDVHAKTDNVRHFKSAVDSFDKKNKGKNVLKLAGGDLNMDTAIKPNILLLKLMNMIGLDASSIGNHELEGGDYWSEVLDKAKPAFKFLSANINFSRPNKIQNNIARSTIIDRNGEKVGAIGVSPVDYKELTLIAAHNNYANVLNFDETVKSVKQEIKQLETKGINKIFLLAHTGKKSKEGLEFYKRLAQIGGIDVIIGGHDHNECDAWYISERGEPVKVVSVGKAPDKNVHGEDLDTFGVFNAIFDNKGVLIPEKCKNIVELTKNYPVSQSVLNMEEEYLQNNMVIGYSDKELTCKNWLTEDNPVASLTADAMLWIVNKETKGEKAQIAFVNAGTVRGSIPKGDITIDSITKVLPFVSAKLIKTTLTKKQIMNTLNWSAKSTTFSKISPGVMQVGGMRYAIDKNNKVKDVYLLNQDGSLGERIDDEPDDKKYTVIYDIFLMTGVAGLSDLIKDPNDPDIEYFTHSRQDALIEYLKKDSIAKISLVDTKRVIKK